MDAFHEQVRKGEPTTFPFFISGEMMGHGDMMESEQRTGMMRHRMGGMGGMEMCK